VGPPRSCQSSWRGRQLDETYVKIKGRWTYIYRAIDKEGKTVDVLVRAKRDFVATKAFFRPPLCAKIDCRMRSRLIAIRHHIGRTKRFSANIPEAKKHDLVFEGLKQFDRVEPSFDQTSSGSDAWIEAHSMRLDHHHRRH
jgi:hypothetical protein